MKKKHTSNYIWCYPTADITMQAKNISYAGEHAFSPTIFIKRQNRGNLIQQLCASFQHIYDNPITYIPYPVVLDHLWWVRQH